MLGDSERAHLPRSVRFVDAVERYWADPLKRVVMIVVGVLVVSIGVAYLWFASNYHSLTWPFHTPERISMHGRDYQRNLFPPLDEVPEPDRQSEINTMMPFGYPIIGYTGYETSTVLYLRWRDGGVLRLLAAGRSLIRRPVVVRHWSGRVTRATQRIWPTASEQSPTICRRQPRKQTPGLLSC